MTAESSALALARKSFIHRDKKLLLLLLLPLLLPTDAMDGEAGGAARKDAPAHIPDAVRPMDDDDMSDTETRRSINRTSRQEASAAKNHAPFRRYRFNASSSMALIRWRWTDADGCSGCGGGRRKAPVAVSPGESSGTTKNRSSNSDAEWRWRPAAWSGRCRRTCQRAPSPALSEADASPPACPGGISIDDDEDKAAVAEEIPAAATAAAPSPADAVREGVMPTIPSNDEEDGSVAAKEEEARSSGWPWPSDRSMAAARDSKADACQIVSDAALHWSMACSYLSQASWRLPASSE